MEKNNSDLDIDFEQAENLYKNQTKNKNKNKKYYSNKYSSNFDDNYSYNNNNNNSSNSSQTEKLQRSRNSSPLIIKKPKIDPEELKRLEEQELKRFNNTVFMYGLPLKANEKRIFEFFFNHNVSPIIDIKLLRDPKTGKSKKCCYIEFDSSQNAMNALALTNQTLLEQQIKIVPSQYEKNRNAMLAKKYQNNNNNNNNNINNNLNNSFVNNNNNINYFPSKYSKIDKRDPPMKIYVGGLTDNLADITESDLQKLFNFGDIDSIELHRDPMTGKCKGYAFIQYHKTSAARNAMINMNGFNYNGKILKVGEANENNTFLEKNYNIGAEKNSIEIRNKFSYDKNSNCVMLSNFFVKNDKRFKEDKYFYEDLYEDIKEMCEKCGKVEGIKIDQNSDGNIWIKFNKEDNKINNCSIKLINMLSCKLYDNRKIYARQVNESLFDNNNKDDI
jgi:RNA recognition motif-containing protein